jgi:hypothetical protein
MAGEGHGNGMGAAWAWHAMCESALRDLNQRKEQTMLLVHLVPSTVPETSCSRILEMQVENMVEQRHA